MANNNYGVRDDVWSSLTPEERSSVASGNQSTIGNLGTTYNPSGSYGSDTHPTQTIPQIQMPQLTPYNPQADIEALKQAQIAANKAALDKQKTASLSSLQREKAQIEPTYQKQKIQARVTAQKTARSFDEYMAQRGGGAAKSGIAGQGVLLNNVAYQGQKGELDTAEANALTSNSQRVTDTENAYLADLTAVRAGANAQAMQMQIQANQQAAAQELAYQQWLYQQQQAQTQNQFSQNMQLAGLTGMYNGMPTMGYSQLTGLLPGGGQTMAAQQQAFNNKMAEQELNLARQKALAPKEPTADDLLTQSFNEVDNLLNQGLTYEQVRNEIEKNEASLMRNKITPSKLYDYLDSVNIPYNISRAKALGLMMSGEL